MNNNSFFGPNNRALFTDSSGTSIVDRISGTLQKSDDNGVTFGPFSSGGFGSDTKVKGNGTMAGYALELLLALTSATPGSESAKWQIFLAQLGTLVCAQDIRPNATYFPQGAAATPSIAFQGDGVANTTGLFYSQLSSALIFSVNGAQQMIIAGGSQITYQGDAALMILGSISQGRIGLTDTFNTLLGSFNAGNMQLGVDGALATNAVIGFVDLPTMPGPPTGAPTRTEAGHRSSVYDTANQKIWTNTTQAGSIWAAVGCNAKLGANLTNADATITVAGGSEYVLPAATLTGTHNLTLGVTGSPITNQVIRVVRFDATANTFLVKDDAATTLLTMPASTRAAADFKFNGTHFVLDRYWIMN